MSHEGIQFATQEELDRRGRRSQPLSREAMTPKKVRVLITEGKGLEVDWADGHTSAWSFAFLREACPCATCVDERGKEGRAPGQPKAASATLLPMYKPPAKPTSAHAVGRYALQFNWLDGHGAGIYSWEYLRRICQCAECKLMAIETHGTPN